MKQFTWLCQNYFFWYGWFARPFCIALFADPAIEQVELKVCPESTSSIRGVMYCCFLAPYLHPAALELIMPSGGVLICDWKRAGSEDGQRIAARAFWPEMIMKTLSTYDLWGHQSMTRVLSKPLTNAKSQFFYHGEEARRQWTATVDTFACCNKISSPLKPSLPEHIHCWHGRVRASCSSDLSATNQQYFPFRTNQQPDNNIFLS
jgi:hypothetical protein